MMSNLTENLASKGYVVVAIDHQEQFFGNDAFVHAFHHTAFQQLVTKQTTIDRIAEHIRETLLVKRTAHRL